MYTQKEINFVKNMIDIYDIRSCFDNITNDWTVEDEGLWFECPNCGEPILVGEDWNLEEIVDCCPVCEETY